MTEPRFAPLALDAAFLITLVTALLFVAGWGYAEQWFGYFDLGLIGLDIPTGYFAMYGYWTLAAHAWWLVLGAALTALVPGVRRWLPGRDGSGIWPRVWSSARSAVRIAAPVLLLSLALLLFWGAYALGRHAADRNFARDRDNEFCTFPYIRVVLKDATGLPKVFRGMNEALAEGRYRLLVQSGGVLALFRTNPPDAPIKPRRPSLVVPVGEVTLMELTPVPPGCGPR